MRGIPSVRREHALIPKSLCVCFWKCRPMKDYSFGAKYILEHIRALNVNSS